MSSIKHTLQTKPPDTPTSTSSMQTSQQHTRPPLIQPHPHHPSSSTTPIDLYPDTPQQPIASSSSHIHRRAPSSTTSSQSTHEYDPEDTYYPPPSTAPTTPDLTSTPARHWRPTPRVPLHIARRHRATQPRDRSLDMGGADRDEDRNRWLSEDEGVGGSTSRSGRRRRRRSGDDGNAIAGSSQGDEGGVGGTVPVPSNGSGQVAGMQAAIEGAKARIQARVSRPIARRAMSHDGPSSRAMSVEGTERVDITTTSGTGGVGGEPPRIQDIVPGPSNVARRVDTMIDRDVGGGSGWDRGNLQSGEELDILGVGSGSESVGNDEVKKARVRQRELLEKLRRILGCALCPPDVVETPPPPLHHPITLPCGHTLSLSHLTLPPLPPLGIPLTSPPHELAAAQQPQQQQRLQSWMSVMCPIPTCKRYSPSMSNSPHIDQVVADIEIPSPPRNTSSTSINYYPPPPSVHPPTYTEAQTELTNEPTPAGSPLLDVCVDKVLHVVMKEIEKFDRPRHAFTPPLARGTTGLHLDIEATDSEGETPTPPYNKSNLSQDLSQLGHPDLTIATPINVASGSGPSSPLVRRSSKRRKNNLDTEPGVAAAATAMNRVVSAGAEGRAFMKDLGRVVECDVCALLLYEPVTTPCQHSFCSKCLSRSLDHSTRCPVCRQDLPSFAFFQDHPVNKVLLTIIKTAFPEEYLDRAQAIERDSRDQLLDTPLFVCTLAFPGMPTILHVFEPRYRLMIRRACESSNPRFGMLLPGRPGDGGPGGMSEYGTMLEIQSVQMLPDGRSMVETVGSFRFRLLEKGSLDGYTIGRIERIDDISPEEERRLEIEAVERAAVARSMVAMSSGVPDNTTPVVQHAQDGSASLIGPAGTANSSMSLNPNVGRPPSFPQNRPGLPAQNPSNPNFPHALIQPNANRPPNPAEDPALQAQTTEELLAICRGFIEQLRSGSAPWLLQRLNNTYGSMPEGADEFSYWMALVMPIDEYEKARLLPIRSPRLRLKLIVHWVESLKSSWW